MAGIPQASERDLCPSSSSPSFPTALGPAADQNASSPTRLVSLDIFRGLVIVVMTIVNYLSPVKGVPAWAKHRPEALEGYTFVDVVFPAFLFMVGIAIPFALGRRLQRGDSAPALAGKILLRSAGLILLGVITANDHLYASEAAPLSKPLWFFLTLSCAMMLCTPAPEKASTLLRRLYFGARLAAGLGLVVLLCLFRGKDEQGHIVWLQHSYWGMLGMIGWAYLASSLCWLAWRDNSTALMAVLGFMLALFVGGRHGALDWLGPLQTAVNIGINFGTNAATVMMGVLVGNCLRAPEAAARPYERLKFIVWFGIGLYLAGSLVRPVHGINKSAHTDAYALVTGGICSLVFGAVYWLSDIRQSRRGLGLLAPLGQNALLAYLLPYLVGFLLGIFGLSVYWSNGGWPGAINAAALTLVVLAITWQLSRWQIRMRL